MLREIEILSLIVANGDDVLELLNKELSMPNIPMPTMGGEVFWNNLAEYNGWRLQQNTVTHHARILDPDNIRRAWGTINGMQTAMKRVMNSYKMNNSTLDEKEDAIEKLKKLKELYDLGIISKEEFDQKKKRYLDVI